MVPARPINGAIAGRPARYVPATVRKSSIRCRYLMAAFAVSFPAVRYGAAIMLAGHVLCGRPVDAANRAFCQRSQRGRGRMPPPRRAFHQQRQSDRSHHDAAGGAHFASPLSTWISDPVMYDDSSASRTGPRRTRLRRDDANEAHRHRRARARRRWRRPIRLNRQQRRYLRRSTPTPRSVSAHSTGVPPFAQGQVRDLRPR